MRRILLIAAALLFLSACATPSTQREMSRPSTAPVELNANLEQLQIDAVMGNPKSASKLSDYYRYERNLDPKWKYWARIAAENGDAGSQFDEYNILMESTDPLSQRRAFFWLRKSAQGGFSYAALELERCFPSGKFESLKSECQLSTPHIKERKTREK